jgi:hypothetical protein
MKNTTAKIRGSMYTEEYLRYNSEAKRPLTPGTYLRYQLKGRARDYADRYERALMRHLMALLAEGVIEPVRSAGGSVAYRYRTADN